MDSFLDYEFNDPTLLAVALTHRSADPRHNERLEFLGDALLGFLIAEFLFRRYPDADEGQLTRSRASLVNKESLAAIARSLDLGSRIWLGEGELKSGGWRRESILANTLEAVVGAIFLDGGLDACRNALADWFHERLEAADPHHSGKDPKTELQEYLQSRKRPLPTYRTVEITGPPHKQLFKIECAVDGLEGSVVAEAHSRRRGEQEAARLALAKIIGGGRE